MQSKMMFHPWFAAARKISVYISSNVWISNIQEDNCKDVLDFEAVAEFF